MPLVLRNLTEADEEAFFEGMTYWSLQDIDWYTFAWSPGMSYAAMLKILDNERKGTDLAPSRVPHSMLYGFLDGKIIGRVSVRHSLNEQLLKRGGNIGYAVSEPFRKAGHATEMVDQALEYCRELGLDKILITCADTNVPSWKIIEKFAGQLENTFMDEKANELIRRYWVKT